MTTGLIAFLYFPLSDEKRRFFRASLQLYKHKEGEKIKPNTYVFPFDIPLPDALPCSQKSSKEKISAKGSFAIEYDLRVIKDTPGKYYHKRDFKIVSADRAGIERSPCLFQPDPVSVEAVGLEGVGHIFMGGRVPDTFVPHSKKLEVYIACKNKSTVDIESVDVIIEEDYSWKTKSSEEFARIKLVEKNNVTKLLPFLELKRIRKSLVEDPDENEEMVARSMFQDLKALESHLSIKTPKSARESYSGSLINISHYVKIIIKTVTKPDSGYPFIRLPIQIVAKSYKNLDEAPPDYVRGQSEVRFPRATAKSDSILLGSAAARADIDKEYGYGPMDTGPSLEGLLEELNAALDGYAFLVNKMKDIEWAIFFGSLSPEDFGTLICNIDFGVVQTKIAALIAKSFGGDFTCYHCAEALVNTPEVFRSNMAECLLPFCSDLAENNEQIRNNLSEFEQIIVALHALDNPEANEEEQLPGAQQRRASRRPSKSQPTEDEESVTKSGSVTPQKDDICMDDNEHPGTIEFLYMIREIVEEGAFQEFAPPVYRRIRKRARGRRFLIRPFEELPHYWRVAADREKIEYCGRAFDSDRENLKTGKPILKDDWVGDGDETGWKKDLKKGGNDWVLAMTVHSYTIAVHQGDDVDVDDSQPAPTDICFGKNKQPGNEFMKRTIRKCLVVYNRMPWSPPVYKAIKAELRGRRYFVPVEDGTWIQASQEERRTEMGKIYNMERNAPKSPPTKRQSLNSSRPRRHSSKQAPSSPKKSPREMDVCFGLADHPGTVALHNAILECLDDFEDTPWGPPVYKAIRGHLDGVLFFIRTQKDAPWREASAEQRIERVRQQFELSRKKKKMKIIA